MPTLHHASSVSVQDPVPRSTIMTITTPVAAPHTSMSATLGTGVFIPTATMDTIILTITDTTILGTMTTTGIVPTIGTDIIGAGTIPIGIIRIIITITTIITTISDMVPVMDLADMVLVTAPDTWAADTTTSVIMWPVCVTAPAPLDQ